MSYFFNLIYQYGLISMFFIILLEYACFPVSSEIVLPFSGAIASATDIPFLLILPVSVAAGLIGTSICFLIGWFGGSAILNAITRKFPKTKKGLDASQSKFQEYGAFAVCVGRVIPICRTYIAFVAGAAKQSPITFFFSSMLGITLWNTILIGLGYFLGSNWSIASSYYGKYKEIVMLFVAIIILTILIVKRIKKKKPEQHLTI